MVDDEASLIDLALGGKLKFYKPSIHYILATPSQDAILFRPRYQEYYILYTSNNARKDALNIFAITTEYTESPYRPPAALCSLVSACPWDLLVTAVCCPLAATYQIRLMRWFSPYALQERLIYDGGVYGNQVEGHRRDTPAQMLVIMVQAAAMCRSRVKPVVTYTWCLRPVT